MNKISFIGIGIMGKSMAYNLLKAGYELHIYARRKEAAQDLVAEGAVFHDSVKSCCSSGEAVITMVGFPADVEEVYFGEGGIMDNAREGACLIDMTTTSPRLAERIYEEGCKRGYKVLDAPVTGGDAGAKAGTLSILVGGDIDTYNTCLSIFEAMGTNIRYHGKAGSGQHAKMANQIMIAGTMSGICEALSYARSQGLDPMTLLESVSTGAAGSNQLNSFGKKIVEGDYAPGFYMKHFIKDMGIALEESRNKNLMLSVLEQTLMHYKELEAEGLGDMGTQALIEYYASK